MGGPPASVAPPAALGRSAKAAARAAEAAQEDEEDKDEEKAQPTKPAGFFQWSPERIAMARQSIVIFLLLMMACGGGFLFAWMNPSPLIVTTAEVPEEAEAPPAP